MSSRKILNWFCETEDGKEHQLARKFWKFVVEAMNFINMKKLLTHFYEGKLCHFREFIREFIKISTSIKVGEKFSYAFSSCLIFSAYEESRIS
jgi:hypothetical protein